MKLFVCWLLSLDALVCSLFVKLNFLITANLINHVVQTNKQKKTFARNILKRCFDGFLPPQMEDGRFCTLCWDCSDCSDFKRLDKIHFSSVPCCSATVLFYERWSPVCNASPCCPSCCGGVGVVDSLRISHFVSH